MYKFQARKTFTWEDVLKNNINYILILWYGSLTHHAFNIYIYIYIYIVVTGATLNLFFMFFNMYKHINTLYLY
jgi:hypothetical protein